MAFADHYPLAAFADVADAAWWRAYDFDGRDAPPATPEQRQAARSLDQADEARLKLHRSRTFGPALRAHLDELRAAGSLAPTGGTAGRACWPATAWNAYVSGEPDDHTTIWLMDRIAEGTFTRPFVRMDDMRRSPDRLPGVHVPPSADKVRLAWEAICAALDGGTSGDQHMGWGLEAQDAASGERCEMTFENWRGALMRRNAEHRLEPAPDAAQLPLVAMGIDVPTGRLLVTDTLRVEGFREGTSFGDAEYGELSLNSEKGCLERTRLHADRHEMAYCQTANTSVDVFRNDATGDIALMEAGRRSMKGWTKAGVVSCDVWRVTMIDHAKAVEAIAAGGVADARGALDRYLALADAPDAWTHEGEWKDHAQAHHEQCYSRNVLRLDVAPGRWTFYSGSGFADRCRKSDFGLPRTARPWAVLRAPRD